LLGAIAQMDELISVLSEVEDDAVTGALDRAFAAHYPDLKRIAHARLSGVRLDDGLSTTALVHESYVKLAQGKGASFTDRIRFLAYASRAIRSIVMDVIREQRALKRGGDIDMVTLNTDIVEIAGGADAPIDVETVHLAIDELGLLDPGLARLVEMRFFGGLTETEIAEATNTSERTVRREWQKARALLLTLIRQ